MKNLFIALVLMAFALISSTTANAKIWRLNNNGNVPNPPIVSDFLSNVTLQQAHDSAKVQSGDTIHVEHNLTNTKAEYSLNKNGSIKVVNSGFNVKRTNKLKP